MLRICSKGIQGQRRTSLPFVLRVSLVGGACKSITLNHVEIVNCKTLPMRINPGDKGWVCSWRRRRLGTNRILICVTLLSTEWEFSTIYYFLVPGWVDVLVLHRVHDTSRAVTRHCPLVFMTMCISERESLDCHLRRLEFIRHPLRTKSEEYS